VWDENAKPQKVPYRVATKLRRAKSLWAPRLWPGSSIQLVTIQDGGTEYRIAKITRVPIGSRVTLFGYAATESATARLAPLTVDAELQTVRTSNDADPFGAEANLSYVTAISTRDTTIIGVESRLARSERVPDNWTSDASIVVVGDVVEVIVNHSARYVVDFESATPVVVQVDH
jgi:hypothetical protein